MANVTALAALLSCIVMAPAFAEQPLKQGTFDCGNKFYETVALTVKQHPNKPHKIIINWENRDRILHKEPTATGALRYEGAISQLVYIQTPTTSWVLIDATMTAILTECLLRK